MEDQFRMVRNYVGDTLHLMTKVHLMKPSLVHNKKWRLNCIGGIYTSIGTRNIQLLASKVNARGHFCNLINTPRQLCFGRSRENFIGLVLILIKFVLMKIINDS